MILLLSRYTVPLAEIDRMRPEHVAWLKAGLAEGKLLLAGRQQPVTGGMLFVRGTLEEARAWAASDPLVLAGATEYQFTEVTPSILAPGLEALAE